MAGVKASRPGVIAVTESDGRRGLGFADRRKGKPFFLDLLATRWQARVRQGFPRGHILRRALGDPRPGPKRLVDATAGFGEDAINALLLGFDVVAIERSQDVFDVLTSGIEIARSEDPDWRSRLSRLRLIHGDARRVLRDLAPGERPHVVYLDPMFAKPKRTAKSPKEMQLLQELLPPSTDEDAELFSVARAVALERVVVKRPLKAPALAPSPRHSFKGQSVRYDVY